MLLFTLEYSYVPMQSSFFVDSRLKIFLTIPATGAHQIISAPKPVRFLTFPDKTEMLLLQAVERYNERWNHFWNIANRPRIVHKLAGKKMGLQFTDSNLKGSNWEYSFAVIH